MGYMSERKLKGEIERMRKEMDDRLKRLEDSLEEASKPRENEPAENKVKEEVKDIKEGVNKNYD